MSQFTIGKSADFFFLSINQQLLLQLKKGSKKTDSKADYLLACIWRESFANTKKRTIITVRVHRLWESITIFGVIKILCLPTIWRFYVGQCLSALARLERNLIRPILTNLVIKEINF
jgi:hypothetical protein